MKNDKVIKYLKIIKKSDKYDSDFIDLLINKGLDDKYDGAHIAQYIITMIEERYVKNQKNIT
ncbi:MAG: hypothetical protein AAB441_00975 [Patescibacteria group bacterium]